MPIRNKRPDLNGLLVIDKPLGWSSADVCRFIRRRTGGAKVGHAGTLDPLATGVLICCLGKATKQIESLMGADKQYRADIDLSAFSSTDDAEGQRTIVAIDHPPTIDTIRATLDEHFAGQISQTPPAFSAVKIGGQRAYKLARQGETPDIKPKQITIHAINIIDYEFPRLVLEITCGKGTYIRSIARDLGARLGTGGMLASLRRVRIGSFTDRHAIAPENLPERIEADSLQPPDVLPGGTLC